MLKLADITLVPELTPHLPAATKRETIRAFKADLLDWLEALADKLEATVADEERRGEIQQAAYQALVNAYVHGSQMSRVKSIHLDTCWTDGTLTLGVTDEGEGFDVQILVDPQEAAQFAFGGRQGIFVIRRAAERVVMHEKGNAILMEFTL